MFGHATSWERGGSRGAIPAGRQHLVVLSAPVTKPSRVLAGRGGWDTHLEPRDSVIVSQGLWVGEKGAGAAARAARAGSSTSQPPSWGEASGFAAVSLPWGAEKGTCAVPLSLSQPAMPQACACLLSAGSSGLLPALSPLSCTAWPAWELFLCSELVVLRGPVRLFEDICSGEKGTSIAKQGRAPPSLPAPQCPCSRGNQDPAGAQQELSVLPCSFPSPGRRRGACSQRAVSGLPALPHLPGL